MPEIELTVTHEAGLHLRPAALFVQTAAAFPDADIRVSNTTRDTPFKNAKSTLDVMMLGVSQGDRIRVQADGPQADAALQALATLVTSEFAGPPASAKG